MLMARWVTCMGLGGCEEMELCSEYDMSLVNRYGVGFMVSLPRKTKILSVDLWKRKLHDWN